MQALEFTAKMTKITHLYRFPFKGLSAEKLTSFFIKAGGSIPLDRRFALALETTPFDPNSPKHFHKSNFVMLMKNERLAALSSHYNDDTGILNILKNNQLVASGNLQNNTGKKAIEDFFVNYFGDEIKGRPRIVEASGYMFSDVDNKVLSCINLASVRELEKLVGIKVNLLRFRANIYFDGIPAWEELDWIGKDFSFGEVKVKAWKLTTRCGATDVNPETAKRDLQVQKTLITKYGHRHLGFYAEVLSDGKISVGDELSF